MFDRILERLSVRPAALIKLNTDALRMVAKNIAKELTDTLLLLLIHNEYDGRLYYILSGRPRRIKQVATTAAVRGTESRHSQLKHRTEFFRHRTFLLAWPGDGDGSQHQCSGREIIDVPSEKLVLTGMPIEPGRKITLGASHIEVDAAPQAKTPKCANTNFLRPRQIKDHDV